MSDLNVQTVIETPAEMNGDAGELLSAVGSAEALPGLSSLLARRNGTATGVAGLRDFLGRYTSEVLLPIELPTVLAAWEAAEEGHFRDLVKLDRDLSANEQLQPFKAASCAVGRRQLNKLRPLRDQRFVQRYRQAMEQGEAAAWHTIVYGIVLSLYSLPPRDGLQHLAVQTMAGFALNAAPDFGLRLSECRRCLDEIAVGLAPQVNDLFAASNVGSANIFSAGLLPG